MVEMNSPYMYCIFPAAETVSIIYPDKIIKETTCVS